MRHCHFLNPHMGQAEPIDHSVTKIFKTRWKLCSELAVEWLMGGQHMANGETTGQEVKVTGID